MGRALQGVGLGLLPLTMSAARDGLPEDRVHPTIALLSVTAAAGVGVGYPISGLIADRLGLSGAFWFGAAFGAVAFVAVALVVPSSAHQPSSKLDVAGLSFFAAGLISLLLAVAQGSEWGWGSVAIIVLLCAAVLLLAIWIVQQLRAHSPLVDLRLLRHPAVLTGDVCALVLGAAMYMNLSAVTEFVQVPKSVGFGFSATVVVAGLCLLPLSILSLAVTRALPGLTRLTGSWPLLALGSLVVAIAGAFFALFHDSLWQAFAMMGILGLGLGLTFAAIPGLIVRAIPQSETGSAMGFTR